MDNEICPKRLMYARVGLCLKERRGYYKKTMKIEDNNPKCWIMLYP